MRSSFISIQSLKMTNLRTRLLLVFFTILFITIGAHNAISGYSFRLEYENFVKSEILHIGTILRRQLEHMLATGADIRDLYNSEAGLRDSMTRHLDIPFAFIVGKDGEPLFSEGVREPGLFRLDGAHYDGVILQHRESIIPITIEGRSYTAAALPIVDRLNGVQGAVIVAVADDYIAQRTNRQFIFSTLQFILFCLIAVLLLGVILTRRVMRPLKKIMHVMIAAGDGNLNARASIRTGDEFAVVAYKLNQMLDHIKELMKSKEEASKLQMRVIQEQERARLSELLRYSFYTINSTLDEDRVQKLVLEQILLFVAYERAGLWMLDEEPEWREKAVHGQVERLSDCVTERIPSFGEYFMQDRHAECYTDSIGHVHIMVIPMLIQHQVAGIIVLERTDRPFERSEADYVLSFTSQANIAISNAGMFRKMERMAITDELTGLYNRRYCYRLVQEAFEQARQAGDPLSVMLFDLDYFKQINDRYGHFVGDEVLHRLAHRLSRIVPEDSVLARFGGEEFICVLHHTDAEQARTIAENIRAEVSRDGFETSAGMIEVTMSVGVTDMHAADHMESFLQRADEACYEAKAYGRNHVVYKAYE